jgi:hypothetical protein
MFKFSKKTQFLTNLILKNKLKQETSILKKLKNKYQN